jgi:hypothetical protein
MSKPTCSVCKFYDAGQCRKGPPQVVTLTDVVYDESAGGVPVSHVESYTTTEWPEPPADGRCGAWELMVVDGVEGKV